MNQERTGRAQQKSYPLNPQTRPYYHSDDEGDAADVDSVADIGYRGNTRDWQNPSRFGRGSVR